uniref:Uncharacterized protein n=1 Tax=Melopsittacus undulatus TaxID=13146 RepID=A0A8C6JFK1_MELUD
GQTQFWRFQTFALVSLLGIQSNILMECFMIQGFREVLSVNCHLFLVLSSKARSWLKGDNSFLISYAGWLIYQAQHRLINMIFETITNCRHFRNLLGSMHFSSTFLSRFLV